MQLGQFPFTITKTNSYENVLNTHAGKILHQRYIQRQTKEILILYNHTHYKLPSIGKHCIKL